MTLTDAWLNSGMQPGSTVLLHSSIRRTCTEHHTEAGQVLDSFLDALGSAGTLVLPLFNFAWTEGVPFDIRSSPSAMGKLTEEGRQHPAAVRSGHPIYSFAAIGAQAPRFHVDNFSGYDSNSPFQVLRDLDGFIAVLDLDDQNSQTFYHHVEHELRAPWRFDKSWTNPYTDSSGRTTDREYGLYVRCEGVSTHVNPMSELLWNQGLYRGERPGVGSGLRLISARAMFDSVADVIRRGEAEGTLYTKS